MNKRQYKKYIKKLGCRSYREYRLKKLLEPTKDIDLNSDEFNIVLINDSRRGDLKHVDSVKVFSNCVPVSCETPYDINIKLRSEYADTSPFDPIIQLFKEFQEEG